MVDGVSFDYPGHRALADVSFSLEQGSITALVGPNGAGKTTLMRCLAALDTPFDGKIAVASIDTAENPRAVHRCVGYLADEFGLYNALTVRRHLLHFAAMHKVPSALRGERVAATAQKLGLEARLDANAGTLSRGWRQRLAIAIAIVHAPRLLILDEPASGLDPEARAELAALLRRLAAEGMTIIVSSHILAELEDYSTHMLILKAGRVVTHGPIQAGDGTSDAASGSIRLGLRLALADSRLAGILAAQPGVSAVEETEAGIAVAFTLAPELAADTQAQSSLLRALVLAGLPVMRFDERRIGMQETYLQRIAAAGGGPSAGDRP